MALSNRSRRLANLPIILATPSIKNQNTKQQISYIEGPLVLPQNKDIKLIQDSYQLPPEENHDLSRCNLETKFDPETLCEFPLSVSDNQFHAAEQNKKDAKKTKRDAAQQQAKRQNSQPVVSTSLKPIIIQHTPPVRRITQHQAQKLLNRQWNSNNSSESILVCQSSTPRKGTSDASDKSMSSGIPQKSKFITLRSSAQNDNDDQTNIMNSQNLPIYAIVTDGSYIESAKNVFEKDNSVVEGNNEIFVTKDSSKTLTPTRTIRIKPDSDRVAIKKARLALFAQTARESLGGKSLVIPSIDSLERSFGRKKKKQIETPPKSPDESITVKKGLSSPSNSPCIDNLGKVRLSTTKSQIINYKRRPYIKNELILSRMGAPKHTYQGPAKSIMKSQTISTVQHHLKPDQVAVVQNGISKLTVLKISESALRHIRESTNPTQPHDKIIPRSVRPVILQPSETSPKQGQAQSVSPSDTVTNNGTISTDGLNNVLCESYDAPIQGDILDGPSALYNDGGDIENTSTVSVADMIRLE